MEYILMRHLPGGHIEEVESAEALLDPGNHLFGAEQLRRILPKIKQILEDTPLREIWHSGVFRAHKTARIIAQCLNYDGELKEDRSLNQYVFPHISDSPEKGLSIIVSHQDVLEEFLGRERIFEGDAFYIRFGGDYYGMHVKKLNDEE